MALATTEYISGVPRGAEMAYAEPLQPDTDNAVVGRLVCHSHAARILFCAAFLGFGKDPDFTYCLNFLTQKGENLWN